MEENNVDKNSKSGSINRIAEEPMRNWRVLAAYVYLLICIFDFVAMPVITQVIASKNKETIVELVKEQDSKVIVEGLDKISAQQWEPITVKGGGMFHISFGAILTGAAVTKGFERREMVRNNGRDEHR